MKLKTKMSLVLGMTILSITPVMQAKAIDVLTYDDIKCTETKEWKEYKKLSVKDKKNIIPPIRCEEMKTKSSKIKTVGAPLITDAGSVTKFDLRDVNGKNYITSVKNQYQTKLDFAFATASSIESNYLMNNGNELNISELQIGFSTSYQLKDGINPYGLKFEDNKRDTVADGGDIYIAGNYLAQRRGVVTEKKSGLALTDDNYKTIINSSLGNLSDVSLNEYNVNDVIFYTTGVYCDTNDFEAMKAIKKLIASYGSVYAKINISTNQYSGTASIGLEDHTNIYYNGDEADHAVSIVGWDDNYSARKFKDSYAGIPKGNGAWIIKDSYGLASYVSTSGEISFIKDDKHPITMRMGDKGYYYVSYYDTQICQSIMAVNNVTPTLNTNTYSYTKPIVEGIKAKKKPLLMSKYKKKNTNTEILESINIYTYETDDNYKIYYGTTTDFSKATLVAEGTAEFEGYKNIKVSKKIAVTDEYYIFIEYTSTFPNYFPVNPVYTTSSAEKYKDYYFLDENPQKGVSFYSLDNGKTWIDSIGDGVDMSDEEGKVELLNFYAPISVFTISRDYDLSILSSTDEPISAEKGGSVSITLELKNVTGDITTKIYNSNKQDVTNKFKITKDSNKYTIAGIVGTTTAGTYTAEFTYKDAVAEKTFKVTSKAPSNVLVEKITIDGKTEVVAGGYLVLEATVTPKDATNKVLTWTSSDKKVATVDQEGIVKAVNEGTATITAEATDGSKVKGTIKIKVIGKKVEQTNNDKKDNTEKSPETGLTSITATLLITMLLSIIVYIVFKKKNLFKRV